MDKYIFRNLLTASLPDLEEHFDPRETPPRAYTELWVDNLKTLVEFVLDEALEAMRLSTHENGRRVGSDKAFREAICNRFGIDT